MARRLEYLIGFIADASSLHAAVDQAILSLQKLGTGSLFSITLQLRDASNAALDLATNLYKAYNQETGHLDLINFNNLLKLSGMTLEEYAAKLTSLGPLGETAFIRVALAITRAELPLKRSSALLDSLWITMKNTMRWQLTSSIMHGFIGGILTAYGYAKSLDESLNSIRIVTSKSAEDMAEFADLANKAAKALSTTTTDYTDASLIYYQQGLSDEEVLARTETTIKLANVSRESAEEASEQLTAIWNNFYDGTLTLESYVDVMAALGATTASSTLEISTGVQKFAAVADTVGLSYNYAASALATITATTRESADVVGTALRTLFARIQGLLQDGEADDGTTLNKYSKALAEVGILIKDTEGNLKDMDTILNEMGATWGTLTKAQQMALAQTVAGVRQYTQLIALMENWSFFQENLTTAMNSEGTLEEQAKIYAESWEAARDRVKAASEDVYDSLINSDFYISVDKALTPFLSRVADIIDALGGMLGVLSVLALAINKVYGDKIIQSLRNFATNINIIRGVESLRARDLLALAVSLVDGLSSLYAMNDAQAIRINLMKQEVVLLGTINEAMSSLDSSLKAWLATEQLKLAIMERETMASADLMNNYQIAVEDAKNSIQIGVVLGSNWEEQKLELLAKLKELNLLLSKRNQLKIDFNGSPDQVIDRMILKLLELADKSSRLSILNAEVKKLGGWSEESRGRIEELYTAIMGVPAPSVLKLRNEIENLDKTNGNALVNIRELSTLLRTLGVDNTTITQFVANVKALSASTLDATVKELRYQEMVDQLLNKIRTGAIPVTLDWASALVLLGSALSRASMGINAINTLFSVFDDENLSEVEKFTRILTSIGMLLPTFVSIGKALGPGILSLLAFANGAATVGVAATGAAGSVATFGAAITAALPVVAAIIAVLGILGATISNVIKKHNEHIKAIREETYETEKASKEQANSNLELIRSMELALEAYELNGDNKDELDEITRDLADAYDLEGAALARLTGQYSDYNQVLLDSYEARREELRKRLSEVSRAKNSASADVSDVAYEGILNYADANGNYNVLFSGYDLEGNGEENLAINILLRYLRGTYDNGNLLPGIGTGFNTWSYSIDPNDIQSFIKLYDELSKAKAAMDASMSLTDLGNSGIYQDLSGWLDLMQEAIDKYREYEEELDTINIHLNEFAQSSTTPLPIEEENISDLAEYRDWINWITEGLEEAGYEGERLDNAIQTLADTSINPNLREFKELSDILDLATELVSARFSSLVEDIFTSGNYDARILRLMNWSTIGSQADFDALYDNLLKYLQALDNLTNAQNRYDAAKNAIDNLEDDGTFDEESLTKLSLFNWGDAEQGIISFNEFLSKSAIEQLTYLHSLMDTAHQDIITSTLEEIAALEETRREALEALANVDQNERLRNEEKVDEYKKLLEQYTEYLDAIKNGELFTPILTDFSNLNITWDDYINDEDLRLEIEEAASDALVYVNSIKANENAVNDLEDEINEKNITIQVLLELEYQDKLDDIRNSTDELVSVFDAISDGVKHTTDQAGLSMWSFSRESAEAIELIYPGFMSMATVLRDGTFALTDDMYNAFFNSTNGIVAANADGMAKILQDLIVILEAKRDQAQAALNLAKSLQEGEVQYSLLTEELKEILALAYLDALKTNNEDLLNNNVELLTNEQTNWSTLWEDVSGYSAQAGTNMAENIADGTESVLLNLESIRDAAYQAGLLVSAIGADNFEDIQTSIDTGKISHSTGGRHTAIDRVDTTSDGFLDSLAQLTTGRTIDDLLSGNSYSDYLLGLMSGHLVDVYQSLVDAYNEMIAANKVAYSKLFESIDNAIDENGGGSGSSKDRKTEDTMWQDVLEKRQKILEDRYHEVNRAIQEQDELLEDIDEDMDLAYGGDRLKLFQKQIEELTKQSENYQWKLNLATHFRDVDKQTLQEALGLTKQDFDPVTGEILHYQDVLEGILKDYENFGAKYDAFILQYNSMSAAEQEDAQDLLDALKKEKEAQDNLFDTRLEMLEKYEDSIDNYQLALDDFKESMRAIEEAKLNKITYKMDVILEIKNAEDAVRDFTKKITESFSDALYNQLIGIGGDRGRGTAQLGYEQAQAELELFKSYQEEYDSLIQRMNEANQYTNMDDLKDEFLDLQGNIISSGEALLDWIDSIENILPDAIDAARERFDQFTELLAHNLTMLDTIEELYTLQGQTYKTQQGFNRLQSVMLERMYAAAADARLNRQWSERAKKDLDVAQLALDDLMAEYANQVTPENPMPWESDVRFDTLKKNRDALLAEFNDAQEAMYKSALEAMLAALDMYLQQVEKAVYDFGLVLSDNQGLDLLQDKYDHYIEAEGRYFDKVNEAYNVAAWYNKLQKAIDDSNNSTLTKNLLALQKEIDLRREGGTLSEYDLEILEAKYKVLEAQAALEDAQNNKNELRLTRDRQGNWNYQYNANPDEVAQKQQELLDAENEWYNLAKQQVNDVTGEIVDTWNECSDKIKDIYSDMTLTDQERADRAAEIYEYYAEKVKYLEQEKLNAIQDMTEAGNKSLFDMAVVAGDDVADLTGITAQEILDLVDESGKSLLELLLSNNEQIKDIVGSNSELIDDFDNIFARDLDNMTKNAGNFEDELRKTLDNVENKFLEYSDKVANVADDVGTNLDEIDTKVHDLSDSTDTCRDVGDELVGTLWDMLDPVQQLTMEYANLALAIMDAVLQMRNLASLAGNAGRSAGNRTSDDLGFTQGVDYSSLMSDYINDGGSYDDERYKELARQRQNKIDWLASLGYDSSYWVGGDDWIKEMTGHGIDYWTEEELAEWFRKLHINEFDTGGYTGNFGDDAKLALVHEKELVLNADDTQNILAAVGTIRALSPELLRSIEGVLDGNAVASGALLGLRLGGAAAVSAQPIEQNVHIEAEFPNVTDQYQIVEAFNDLVNLAAQRVRRRTS